MRSRRLVLLDLLHAYRLPGNSKPRSVLAKSVDAYFLELSRGDFLLEQLGLESAAVSHGWSIEGTSDRRDVEVTEAQRTAGRWKDEKTRRRDAGFSLLCRSRQKSVRLALEA
jgi:hypothetical protein